MIEKTLAGDVVIQTENVGRHRIVEKPCQFAGFYADVTEVLPHTLAAIQTSGKQIKGQPAAFVFKLRLVSQRPRAVGLAEIFRLNQTRLRVDLADLTHRES